MLIDERFTSHRILGSGAYGEVHLVHDPEHDTEVALKLLRLEPGRQNHDQLIARFKAEFSVLTTLKHPHISGIGDFGYDTDRAQYYFTAEYIQGATLRDVALGQPYETIEALMVQALRALQFLHSHAVFHFDLKPANILVDDTTGQVKVIDFGMANLPGQNIAGTPSYMAPEICGREPRDGRADLYAMGCIWYECLTGTNPFRGRTLQETLDNQRQMEPPRLSTVRPEFPEYLDFVLHRLLAKNPHHRYQQAADVVRDINFRGGRSYALETDATRGGYLPEVGELIGCAQSWAQACQTVETCTGCGEPPILVIAGGAGMGKTRFCQELRYMAQVQGRPPRICDFHHPIDATALGDLRLSILEDQTSAHLIVVALYPADADALADWLPPERLTRVTLPTWDTAAVADYLAHVTGIADMPAAIVTTIAQRTEGTPRLIRELLSSAIGRGTFLDDMGRWNADSLRDLESEISHLPLPTAFDDWFTTRLQMVPVGCRELLTLMALCTAAPPRWSALSTSTASVDDIALLIHEGWIVQDADHLHLVNPALRSTLITALARGDRKMWHDRILEAIADFPDEVADHHRIYCTDHAQAAIAFTTLRDTLLHTEDWESLAAALAWLSEDASSVTTAVEWNLQRIDTLIELRQSDEITRVEATLDALAAQLPTNQRTRLAQARAVTQIEWALRRGALDEARRAIADILATPDALPATTTIRLQNYQGRLHIEAGDLTTAEHTLTATWAATQQLSTTEQHAITNNDLGLVYLTQEHWEKATIQYRQEVAAMAKLQDPYLEARARYNLSRALQGCGDLNGARTELTQAYDLIQTLHRHDLMLGILNGLGTLLQQSGDEHKAIDYFRRGLRLAQHLGDKEMAATLAANLGILLNRAGEEEDAVTHLLHATHLLQKRPESLTTRTTLARCQLELAHLYRDLGNQSAAVSALTEAKALAAEGPAASLMSYIETEAEEISMMDVGWKELAHINQQLARVEDVAHLEQEILHHAVTLSQAECGMIFLLDGHRELELKAALHIEPDAALKRASHSVAQQAIAKDAPIITADAKDESDFQHEQSVMIEELRAICCLPIHAAGRILGCLYLSHQRKAGAFDQVDMDLLSAFSDLAGVVIDRTKRLQQAGAQVQQLESDVSRLEEEVRSQQGPSPFRLKDLHSRNPQMGKLFALIAKVMPTDLSVFIHGETGTGKEVIARTLHTHHPQRGKGPFIAICCGAIPATLMESELFGYKAGAFTGAAQDKAGLFEAANGGTLFLDEIAEMPLELQAKLLRALQEKEVRRVGDTKTRKIDCRIISASHQNLQSAIQRKTFREDLYYRLCQIQIDIPPLRDRAEDLPMLAALFVTHYCRQHHVKASPTLDRTLLRLFMGYAWPGNVRELENLIEAMCALSDGKVLQTTDIPPHHALANATPQSHSLGMGTTPTSVPIEGDTPYDPMRSWRDYEVLIIAKAFGHYGQDAKATATALGISIAKLYKMIKQHDLKDPDNALYALPFVYQDGTTLRAYTVKVFSAALLAAGGKPYHAIRNLSVSPGYFYKMKGKESVDATS